MKRIVFLFLMMGLISCQNTSNKNNIDKAAKPRENSAAASDGLNRHPSSIHYSKHARCRMECRHINESEIKNLLETGEINYKKSELNGDACHQKYAVEGYVQNNHLRIIFAPCNNVVTVVTCIDLAHVWSCDCPGDHH